MDSAPLARAPGGHAPAVDCSPAQAPRRGPVAAAAIRLALAVAVAAAVAPAAAQVELAREKSCLGCHAIDRKVVGPSYRDVAATYAGRPDAVERLAAKIRLGGAGVWGPVPMPANPQVSDAEARRLAQWVLTLK